MIKIKCLIACVLLSVSSLTIAQVRLEEHLIFQPQNLEIYDSIVGLHQLQAPQLLAFFQHNQHTPTLGTTTVRTKNKPVKLHLSIDSAFALHDEYMLHISKSAIHLQAKNMHALRYGIQTMHQILLYMIQEKAGVSAIHIHDWADFERRGYMLDISRDKVPTMSSLYALIDQLYLWRFNELQLYTEHTFAYQNHAIVWQHASPLTASEVQELNAYCLQKGIDLVPNQNSFGHMENWLKHDEYLDLCECETTCKTIWGNRKRTALAPTNHKSLELMQELYAELLPNFTSRYANIGGDETVELGLGKSKELCKKIGKGQVYLDFLKKLNDEINAHNKLTMFWGDIVLNHEELIPDIPKNMIALVWGYESDYPFEKNLPKFKNAALDFYVCPGTSSWRSAIGRNHNAFLNLKHAATQGKKYGAKGYLITDWGDYGHFQPASVSYPSLMLGASYAWNSTRDIADNLEFLLNHYLFKDSTAFTAKALLTLGNAYLLANIPEGNANAFHLMIHRYAWTMDGQFQTKLLTISGLTAAKKEIEKGIDLLHKAQPTCPDATIILKELDFASQLAIFGINLGIARLQTTGKSTKEIPRTIKNELIQELQLIIEAHKSVWLLRNREGGLYDSAGKLEDIITYLSAE